MKAAYTPNKEFGKKVKTLNGKALEDYLVDKMHWKRHHAKRAVLDEIVSNIVVDRVDTYNNLTEKEKTRVSVVQSAFRNYCRESWLFRFFAWIGLR